MPYSNILKNPKTPLILLACLIIAYTAYFSWYTLNRHNSLNSYAADLSLIDQPMWNTVRGPGGFMEQTWGDHQQPRLAEHFEPILIPIALLFYIWDDVRILLIAQTLALALGAIPIFWIARRQFTKALQPDEHPNQILHSLQNDTTKGPITAWTALAFTLTYLLFPHLQAANIADFHADPFVVTPLLFAFWYGIERRWGWMWLWAIIAMATKETLPTLTAMLGLYLLFNYFRTNKNFQISNPQSPNFHLPSAILHPSLLILLSTTWFLIATFLIVSPLAQQYFGTDGPIYLENRYSGGLGGLLPLLQDPGRWTYLGGLLMAVGFLPLLAPELLILGLPVLVANLLSNFPGQYSGEQHYSAPLVVAFIISAIYGTARIVAKSSLRENNEQLMKHSVLIGATLWLLTWAVGYHALHGWTPFSVRTETYTVGAAAAHLPRLLAQIPAEAIVSASPGLHPHLAHRQVAYVFPIVEEADYLLVDVSDISGVHPNDVHQKLTGLLGQGWNLIEAQHGLLFAQKSTGIASGPLPNAFFDFVRTNQTPTHPTNLSFNQDKLRLLGYDINDDPDDGVIFRFYWQATDTLPKDLHLWPLIYDDLGQLLSDPSQVPMVATVWYPPASWQHGEVIVTETLPQHLPPVFHLGMAAGPTDSLTDITQRWPIHPLATVPETITLTTPRPYPGHWMQLATFVRKGPFLSHLPPQATVKAVIPLKQRLGSDIYLTGYWLDSSQAQPNNPLPILLRWQTTKLPAENFTVFIHLLGPEGQLVAQSDAYPTWLTPSPTSQWQPDQAYLDRHSLALPSDLPSGQYTLQVGLYQAQTLERLRLADGQDVIKLDTISIK